MKKKLNIFILFILIISLLAGCSPKDIETDEIVINISPVLKDSISTCYSLFPIAFADSNGDGLGDINGIRDKLDYFKNDLGVDCIWLNPIHPSPTYHKYDVVDYLSVDPDFGTMDNFENLIKEIHDRDMYLIMDFVINHTSSKHPWFQAAKQKDEKYRDYYRWLTAEELKEHHMKTNWYIGGNTYYYAGFWSEMPELNLENEDVRNELNAIAEFWLNKGIDGFRIDAAMHLYDKGEYPEGYDTFGETISYFREFSDYIKSVKEDAFIISEVSMNFKGASAYYAGMESLFNFDFGEDILAAAYVGSNNISEEVQYYLEQMAGYNGRVMGTFLSNHDQNRSIEALASSLSRARVAANLMLTLPGLPFIYYGEELGMKGKKPDENIREPFIWGEESDYTTSWNLSTRKVNENTLSLAEQKNDDTSLFNTYKKMIQIRKENPVLQNGDIAHVETGVKALIAYRRFDPNTNLLVVHNTLEQEYILNFNPALEYEIVFSQDPESRISDKKLYLGGRSVIIINLMNNDLTSME